MTGKDLAQIIRHAESRGWEVDVKKTGDVYIAMVYAPWTPLHPQLYCSYDSYISHLAAMGIPS